MRRPIGERLFQETRSATHWRSLTRPWELNIEVLAITDHNNVNGVADFRSAARNDGVD